MKIPDCPEAFTQARFIRQSPGALDANGRHDDGVETSFTAKVSVQPMRPDAMVIEAIGERGIQALEVFANVDLRTLDEARNIKADVLKWRGLGYEIHEVDRWLLDAPLSELTQLLLHMDEGEDSPYFEDSSLNRYAVTPQGGALQDTAQFMFAPSSLLLDGVDDDLLVADDPGIDLGIQDFTFDCWVRVPSLVDGAVLAIGVDSSDRLLLRVLSTGQLGVQLVVGGTTEIPLIKGGTIVANTWHHVALDRNGDTWRIYTDGTPAAEAGSVNPTLAQPTSGLSIGSDANVGGGDYLAAHVDEARLVVGRGIYAGGFLKPDQPNDVLDHVRAVAIRFDQS